MYYIWIDTGSQSYAILVVDMFKKLLLIIHFKCFKTKYSAVSLTLKDTQDKKKCFSVSRYGVCQTFEWQLLLTSTGYQ